LTRKQLIPGLTGGTLHGPKEFMANCEALAANIREVLSVGSNALRMAALSRPTGRNLAIALLVLGLLGLAGCESAPAIEDGTWDLRIDRQGDSEDAEDTFGFLPETSYHPVEDGPTYRVAVSEEGTRVSFGGGRTTYDAVVSGKQTSTADGRLTYDLTGLFAGGRFVVWKNAEGLQGEFTIYGSGRPIISSERGRLVRAP
jgi:hypothetical protein